MISSLMHFTSIMLRLIRGVLVILMLLCVPAMSQAQKTRILPPKRPESKPVVKPKPKPAPKKKANPTPAPAPEPVAPPTVSEASGLLEGYGYVDLGLPSGTKWATCNVGASTPEGYGEYFAWGEIAPKDTYTDAGRDFIKDNNLGDISGNPQMDAARANWGGTWRLPTPDECDELLSKCRWTYTTHQGHNGYIVTGPSGKSIFLPMPGSKQGPSPAFYTEECGEYMMSELNRSGSIRYILIRPVRYACDFGMYNFPGISVRPVAD